MKQVIYNFYDEKGKELCYPFKYRTINVGEKMVFKKGCGLWIVIKVIMNNNVADVVLRKTK
jgi:hypothetical protein